MLFSASVYWGSESMPVASANYGYIRNDTLVDVSLIIRRLPTIIRPLLIVYLPVILVFAFAGLTALVFLNSRHDYAPSDDATAVIMLVISAPIVALFLYLARTLFKTTIVRINDKNVQVNGKLFAKSDIRSPGFEIENASVQGAVGKLGDWLTSLDVHHVRFWYGSEKRYCASLLTKRQAEDICEILNSKLELR